MNLLLYGAPGSGKGTQANMLRSHFGIPHIATGDMLRAEISAGTPLGQKAQPILAAGHYVSDDIMIGMIRNRLVQPDCLRGFIIDGFPRTIPQAEAMKASQVPIEHVVDLNVPDAAIVERMSGRWSHVPSGRTYHVKFNPPAVAGKDDVTGEPLTQREDDREPTVRNRLEIYHRQTEPLIDYYAKWAASADARAPKYHRVDGLGTVEEVRDRIFACLGP